jgi:hypothetical protein
VEATFYQGYDSYTNTYTYDAENRLISARKYSIWDSKILYTYDYVYDTAGNLVERTANWHARTGRDETERVVFSYDPNGRIVKKEYHTFNMERSEYIQTSEYVYDESGYVVEKKSICMTGEGRAFYEQHLIFENDENGNPRSATLDERINGAEVYTNQHLSYAFEKYVFYTYDRTA